jgi:Tfp pilus assembly protein PilN
MLGKDAFNFVGDGDRPIAAAWLLLVLGIIAMAIVADNFAAVGADTDRLERQAERFQRKSKTLVSDHRKPEPEKSAVVVRRQGDAFPWDSVLTELELAVDSHVALLGLNTEVAARRTMLTGEARNIDDVLAFAARLRESPLVREAFLVSHEVRRDGPVPVVAFSVQVLWSVE